MIGRHGTKVISRSQGFHAFRNIVLLYNPYAGGLRGSRASRLLDAQKGLSKYGAEVVRVATDGPRGAGRLAARAIANGADLIVVAGGDGTINEAMDGMVGGEVPMAILPAGTANVLACEMGIPGNISKAADSLATYSVERISTGRITSRDAETRPFLLMAGVGLDALVVYSLDATLKRRFGKIAYWLAGFRQFGRTLEEFTVRIDGRDYRSSFALVSKVRNYGGDLEIAQEVSLFDDQFEVVLFHGRQSWKFVPYLAAVATRQHRRLKALTIVRAREVEMSNAPDDRVYVQVDGEFVGHLPARVEIVPASLNLLVPPKYLSRRRGHTESELATRPAN